MKIGIISGSHRNPSQSEKVARHIESRVSEVLGLDTWFYTLADNPLPLWDEAIWEGDAEWKERLAPLQEAVSECDGFVVVSPEWHGMAPAGLKNFMLMFNRFQIGHKPVLIAAVSNGPGGSYPVAELRMSSYKNNRLCYIPEQLIIRDVEKVLNENADENDSDADDYFRRRIDWALGVLQGYAVSLKDMRANTEVFHDDFGNGM